MTSKLSAVHGTPLLNNNKGNDLSWFDWLCMKVQEMFESLLSRSFYCGFEKQLPEQELQARAQALRDKGACVLQCTNGAGTPIDAVIIPSQAKKRTGNVVVFSLVNPYLRYHPKYYESYLHRGADVVLWDPTKLTPMQSKEDLSCIVRTLLAKNPKSKIALQGYCVTVDPSIAVAAETNNPNVSLILDRGYGEVGKLVRSMSTLGALSCVKRAIETGYDCKGIEKIAEVKGNVLFLAPEKRDDQLLSCGEENLTRNLFRKAKNAECIDLEKSDHWTTWNGRTHESVHRFLFKNGILSATSAVSSTLFPDRAPPSDLRRWCFRNFNKAWC
jgi:hypothetical protein